VDVRRVVVAVIVAGVLVGCGGAQSPVARPPTSSSAGDETQTTTSPPTPAASTSATASAEADPSTAAATPTWPPYAWSARPVTADRLGSTYQAGCPVGPEGLRLISVFYVGFDGKPATGELVVAAEIVEDVGETFRELYEARFLVRKMITIEAYGGDDDASMADDNTSAFNCRQTTGGSGWSQHSYGTAIDINPRENPYVRGDVVLPPRGTDYLDRADVRPGMIVDGDVVVRAFTSRGFEWGGAWTSLKDYQHVEVSR